MLLLYLQLLGEPPKCQTGEQPPLSLQRVGRTFKSWVGLSWAEPQQSCPGLGLRMVPSAWGVNSGSSTLSWGTAGPGVVVLMLWSVMALCRG